MNHLPLSVDYIFRVDRRLYSVTFGFAEGTIEVGTITPDGARANTVKYPLTWNSVEQAQRHLVAYLNRDLKLGDGRVMKEES